jgi:transcription elongation factor Elf1
VIPLACREFDNSHCGFRHALGEMTIVCGKCGTLHFLEEHVASSLHTNLQVYSVLHAR